MSEFKPWEISDDEAVELWKEKYAWDLDESEIFEVMDKSKEEIAKGEKFNIFVKWFTKPKVVNLRNFNAKVCRELGGVWEEHSFRKGWGYCTLFGLKDILPFDTEWVEVSDGVTESVTDFSKEGIVRLGFNYSLPFNVRVEDVVRFSGDSLEVSAILKDFPHLAFYTRKKKVVIKNCEEYIGGRTVRGLCVGVSDMSEEDEKKYSRMIEEIDRHISREEPFDLEDIAERI